MAKIRQKIKQGQEKQSKTKERNSRLTIRLFEDKTQDRTIQDNSRRKGQRRQCKTKEETPIQKQ
jgi:hypothetical protein